ncbi:hypothetical protein QL285_056343 [Trifolium repens]|nr:hypothetical protein QL285_056343 [Trifolium repens]
MACIDNDTLSHKLEKWLSYLIKWLGYLFLLVQLLKIWTHFALTFGKFVTILTKGFLDFSKYNEILILYWILKHYMNSSDLGCNSKTSSSCTHYCW